MEEKLVQYKMWLNAEIANASKKILDANKKGHNSDASYWKGMLNGLERYTKKLTDLKLSEHKKEILNEITTYELGIWVKTNIAIMGLLLMNIIVLLGADFKARK